MRLSALLRWLQAVVGALGTTILAASQTPLSDPHRWAHWTRDEFWLVTALVGLTLIAFVVPAAEAVTERSHRRERELSSAASDILMTEFQFLQAASALDYRELGLHAFVVHRSLRHPWHGSQKRVAKVRLGRVGIDHELDWTRGKGVVGLCWAAQTDQVLDYEAWAQKYQGVDRALWNTLGPDERLGLTLDELERTRTNFGGIAASPMFDARARYVGAVSADGPLGSFQALSAPDVLDRLQATAQVLARVIRPVSQ